MDKDPNSYVTRAELQEMATAVLANFVTRAEMKTALDESLGQVIEAFKNPSPATVNMIRRAVAELKNVIFVPPDEVDLVPDDAICKCGHQRIDHCGCGSSCHTPANDIERAKANRGESFSTIECRCEGFNELSA